MRASEKVYETLRREIIEWDLAPGTILAEVELSERLGVSRTPVREALARLVADGLASQYRGRGTVVSEISLDHIEDLFVLRQALEVESAKLAAKSGVSEPFARLERAFSDQADDRRGLSDPKPYYALISELDQQIDKAADNEYLSSALSNIRVHLSRVRRMSKDHPERLIASAWEHAQIARAIRQQEPELAAAATMIHLNQAMSHILTHAETPKGTS